MRFCKWIFLLALSLATLSCERMQDRAIYFIGDSEIERWDLSYHFPSERVVNMGKGGSGIKYLKSLTNVPKEAAIVLLSGTNDLAKDSLLDIEAYVNQYSQAILQWGASEVFVISVLPRNVKGDDAIINTRIETLNAALQKMAQEYGWKYVDVFGQLVQDGKLNMQYSYDGLHLNSNGYDILTAQLRKVL